MDSVDKKEKTSPFTRSIGNAVRLENELQAIYNRFIVNQTRTKILHTFRSHFYTPYALKINKKKKKRRSYRVSCVQRNFVNHDHVRFHRQRIRMRKSSIPEKFSKTIRSRWWKRRATRVGDEEERKNRAAVAFGS